MKFYMAAITAKRSLKLFFFKFFTAFESQPIIVFADYKDNAITKAWDICLETYPIINGYYEHEVIICEIPRSFIIDACRY